MFNRLSGRAWMFSDLILAIFDLIVKLFDRNMSGMEPSFKGGHWTLDTKVLEANGIQNATLLFIFLCMFKHLL